MEKIKPTKTNQPGGEIRSLLMTPGWRRLANWRASGWQEKQIRRQKRLKSGRRDTCSRVKMGNRTEGRPDWTMVKPETEREQRQEQTETTVLRSKSNQTQKRGTTYMSNKNRFLH
jgi:hypothetical protein